MNWPALVAAMVTAAVAALGQSATGTLVVTTDTGRVQPVAFTLRGPVVREVPLEGAPSVTVAGLPQGEYQVVAVFAGAVQGAPVQARVQPGHANTVHIPTAHLGGLRFDADVGMCEPTDSWTLTGLGRITVMTGGRTVRSTAGVPPPHLTHCQRELGGLHPGSYRVVVTPPGDQLPPYDLTWTIQAGEWTQMRLVHPPVVVRGRVTSNGAPVPGVDVDFMPTGDTSSQRWPRGIEPSAFQVVPTGEDGRYARVLSVPGTYKQVVRRVAQGPFSDVVDVVNLAPGVNVHDIEVAAGTIRVWLTEHGMTPTRDLLVTLTLQALPGKPIIRVVTNPAEATEIGLLAPGTYVVRATAESRQQGGPVVTLAGSREHEVVVSGHQAVDVNIDLVPRDGWLKVVSDDGTPVEGAYVLTYPGATALRTDAEGQVSLGTVPVGTRLPVRTRTWGVTCHVVTTDLLQRVAVADATEAVVLRFPHGPADVRPQGREPVTLARSLVAGATVVGITGATCPLPMEALSIAEGRIDGAIDLSIMLPRGDYTLALRDGRQLALRAPGTVVIK